MEENQSSLEAFFNPTRGGGLLFNDGFATNQVSSFATPSKPYGESTNCLGATDCGSGYNCVGGKCVHKDETTSDSSGSGGPTPTSNNTGGGGGTCQDGPKECEDGGCQKPTCGQGNQCEIRSTKDCCSGTMYTCGFDAVSGQFTGNNQNGCPQCEPCEDPDRECRDICDSYYKANGVNSPSLGCSNVDGTERHCGKCQRCFALECVDWDDAPCWCKPNGRECPDCEECNRTTGECEAKTGTCNDCSNCSVTCPCGTKVNCSGCWEHYRNGLAAPAQCRQECYQKFCVNKEPLTHTGRPACPDQKDPCKADPGNKCELECKCRVMHGPCSDFPDNHPPAPPGWRIMPNTKGYLITGGPSQDANGCADDNGFGGGGVTWLDKICRMNESDPDCEKCDCLCSNDCPDCYICGANGECQYDSRCDAPCDEPCNGYCCGAGDTCQPGVIWEVIDACHYQGGTFVVPAGVTPQLQHTTDVPASHAICNRFHTHCNVVVNGVVVETHLDCQKGLRQVGPAGYNICG